MFRICLVSRPPIGVEGRLRENDEKLDDFT